MTPAERQRKCRAIKRAEWHTIMSEQEKQRLGLPSTLDQPALPSPPGQPALPAPEKKKLPPPPSGTAIEKAFAPNTTALARPGAEGAGDGLALTLPPGVAARLKSLLDRHEAGKNLTAAERAEAQGLLDIAEYFVVQRLRNRLAA